MKTRSSLARSAAVCAALLFTMTAFAQDNAPPAPGAEARPARSRARDRTPSWLMDPVQGPNLHYKTFDSQAAGTKVSYLLYLPPGYDEAAGRRYPVVYWLHGIGGSQQGVPDMARRMNQAIKDGKMPPVIFVFCNGMIRGGWSDAQWPVETVTIKELIPHIDATYRTIATREGRGVEGFSMGGGGASVWGFKYTDLFGTVSIIAGAMRDPGAPPRQRPAPAADAGASAAPASAAPAGNDAPAATADAASAAAPAFRGPRSNPWELVEKNGAAIRGRTFVRIAVGEKDPLKIANTSLHEFLTKHDIEHGFDVVSGAAHSPGPVYEGLGDKNWAFYQEAFGRLK
jgi:endo-1,4-beta-xylanase